MWFDPTKVSNARRTEKGGEGGVFSGDPEGLLAGAARGRIGGREGQGLWKGGEGRVKIKPPRQVRGGNSFVRVQTIFQTLQVFIGFTDSNGLLDLGFQGFEVFWDRWMLVFGCLDVAFVGSLDVGL